MFQNVKKSEKGFFNFSRFQSVSEFKVLIQTLFQVDSSHNMTALVFSCESKYTALLPIGVSLTVGGMSSLN
jgi:hypothetical protein